MYDFSYISLYFNSNGKLIGVPCGNNSNIKYSIALLDVFFVLEHGYSDDELEAFIAKVLDACYSKVYEDSEPTAIQKYTKAKNYISAVKGYQYMTIERLKDKGYTVSPWQVCKKYKGSFIPIKGISIKVSPHNKSSPIEKGALALAFRKAMEIIEQVSNPTINELPRQTFILLCEKEISYVEPQDECFINAKDYGTGEIYQGYSYHKEGGDDSVAEFYFSFAAELDCNISPGNIRKKWEKIYGRATTFETAKTFISPFALRAEFKNKSIYKISYYCQINKFELFACELEIKRTKSEKRLNTKLVDLFKKLAKSVVLTD
jgi:hypothetical protein